MRLLTTLLMLLALPALAGQVYRWTDAQGNVNYTDQPPPAGAKNTSQKDYKSGGTVGGISPEMQQARLKNPITLYTSANCGVLCDRAKAHLAKRNIPYNSKDPAASVEANEELRAINGKALVPSMMIGKEKLEGFSESAWDAALDKAGYPGPTVTVNP